MTDYRETILDDDLLGDVETTWVPVDLVPVLNGTHTPLAPTLMRSKDGVHALFYEACVNGLHGDSGIGKSWVVDAAATQEIQAGHNVIIIDYESTAAEVVARLLALGLTADSIRDHLIYIRPDSPTSWSVIDDLTALAAARDVTLIVVDSIGEAFAVDGIDENHDAEVGPWMRAVPRRLADTGPAVALVDHGTKAADNPLHPSGSKRKRAAITGASYLVEPAPAPTKDEPGRLRLTCAKDRHGTYQRGKVIANVDITPYPDNGVTVTLWPATTTTNDDGVLAAVARKMVVHIRDANRTMSRNELETCGAVKASRAQIRGALDHAESKGALTVEAGPRRAHLYRYMHDLEAPTT